MMIFSNLLLAFKLIRSYDHYYNEKEANVMLREANNELFVRDLDLLSQDVEIPVSIFKKDIPANSSCLIFIYSGEECDKCIFEDISILKEKFARLGTNNLIILPVFEDSRNIEIQLNANLDGLKYFRLDPNSVKLPTYEGSTVRFFAILSPTGKIRLTFFPDIVDRKRTRAYLDFVIENIFE